MVREVKRKCAEKLISVAELERAVALPKNSIYKWDRNVPSVKSVLKVARYLGTTVEELAGEGEKEVRT